MPGQTGEAECCLGPFAYGLSCNEVAGERVGVGDRSASSAPSVYRDLLQDRLGFDVSLKLFPGEPCRPEPLGAEQRHLVREVTRVRLLALAVEHDAEDARGIGQDDERCDRLFPAEPENALIIRFTPSACA